MSHHWTRSDSPRRRKIIAGIGSTLCILAVAITVVIQAQMAKAFDEAFDEALSETAVAEDSEQPADAPEDAPAHNSGEDVTRLGFGATHRWSGGEVITVSKPSPYKEENPFLAPNSVSRLDLDRCSGQDHRLWLMRCHSGWFPTSSGSWSSR